ncbi:MAG: hypothetical protein EA379_09525 [Phycisphaerales bacterium]|nr:MAG: hypothetical protein EA379_09525 [Phycisphaerales bacterium]
MPKHLTQQTKITRTNNRAAGATTDLDGAAWVDMAGFDGVRAVAILDDVTATSALSLQVLQADTAAGAGSEVLAGSAEFVAGASDADNKVIVTDVLRPSKRFVRTRLKRGTANAVVDAVLLEQYSARDEPTEQSASVLSVNLLTDPAAV